VSQAIVRRLALPADATASVAKATLPEDRAAAQAELGLWYDMLGSLSGAIEKSPSNVGLRQQRTAVLAQLGLPAVPPELKAKAGTEKQ
jgi:hypothetical protein